MKSRMELPGAQERYATYDEQEYAVNPNDRYVLKTRVNELERQNAELVEALRGCVVTLGRFEAGASWANARALLARIDGEA